MSSSNPERVTQENINLRNSDVFQDIYLLHRLMVFRFIYGLHGGPTEEVEDITAETFARAWKSRRRFQGSKQAALGWLIKIARNLVIDSFRRNRSQVMTQDIEKHYILTNELQPEEQALMQEQAQVLWSLMQNLPHQQREILVLRYMLGWRVQEIGKHLAMKENTVSVNIRRALQRLRQDWPETNYEKKS
jgi:RNA polymerase sigma-70 factor (ECF subfamily)